MKPTTLSLQGSPQDRQHVFLVSSMFCGITKVNIAWWTGQFRRGHGTSFLHELIPALGEFGVGSLKDMPGYSTVNVHPSWEQTDLDLFVGLLVVFLVGLFTRSHSVPG